MKTTIIAFLLFLTVIPVRASLALTNVIPPSVTNISPEAQALANAIGALRANVTDMRNQDEAMQHRMNRVETGFLVVVILLVIAVVAMCFLNAKNHSPRQGYGQSDQKQPVLPSR